MFAVNARCVNPEKYLRQTTEVYFPEYSMMVYTFPLIMSIYRLLYSAPQNRANQLLQVLRPVDSPTLLNINMGHSLCRTWMWSVTLIPCVC